MSLYDFDIDLYVEQITPPNRRKNIFLSWLKAILSPLQYLHTLFFSYFVGGSSAAAYSNVTAYVAGDLVKYTDKSIYECILATTGNAPTNSTYWRKIQNSFVGVREQAKYSAQNCVFEYALNKWFGTTWSITVGASDIFITTNSIVTNAFLVGSDSTESSAASFNDFLAVDFVGLPPSSFDQNAFTINVPTAVFNALGSTTAEREAQIRFYADKIKLAGTIYNIVTY